MFSHFHFNKKKMSTILKVVLCSLFIFFSSCSKFEEEQKQTQVFPNINEAQAKIGGENWYEKHVNVEDFKNSIMTDFESYQKDLNLKRSLLSYNSFPNVRSKEDLSRISRQIYYTFGRPANRSHFNSGKFLYYMMVDMRTEPYVECFLKQYVNEETKNIEYQLYLPKEVYDLSHKERTSRVHGGTYDYVRREVPVSVYCSLTGIPRNLIENLRVVTRQDNQFSYLYYQMPYKDNYLDYQNETQEVNSLNDLKKFIKKGSMIFVFNEDLKELDKDRIIGWGNWWHMLIVSDWYIEKTDKYKPLKEYQILERDESFTNAPYLHGEVIDDNISFAEYLKHFVLIEAQDGAELYSNNNNEDGFENHVFTVRTSGNDKSFQMKLGKYTCVAVVNVNEGLTYSQPDLIVNMIKNADRQIEKEYNSKPTGLDNDTLTHYCSGLAYYSLLNGRKTPSLRLLKYEHTSTNPLLSNKKWYMPRTVCNSPFVYTRVWKKEKK